MFNAGVAAVVVTVCAVLLFWILSKGYTPAKWALGLHVVDKVTGSNPGLLRMLLREIIGKFISAIFLWLGYIWALWDRDSQAWHDKIVGTVVVRLVAVPETARRPLAGQ